MKPTYRDLIRPIPAKLNLCNVTANAAVGTCNHCKTAVPERSKARNKTIRTTYERVDEYPDFPEIKSSAKAGCELCRIIRKALRQAWAVRPMEEWGVGPLSEKDRLWDELFEVPWDRKVRMYNLAFSFEPLLGSSEMVRDSNNSQRGGMVTGMTLEFGPATRGKTGDGEPLHGDISQVLSFKAYDSIDLESVDPNTRRRLPSTETLSEENVQMILSWISECKSKHLACRIPEFSTPWLPTRLLDVGSDVDSRWPRVVETKGLLGSQVTYAALSHMWGDVIVAPPLRTMDYNYAEMTSGISVWRLPLNFADAVKTCRRLGIQYIWIDSLCIIQDNGEDWRREAGTMHLVYKNAEVTIVATSASSSHDGFLVRNVSLVPAAKIQYSLEGSGDGLESNTHSVILVPLDDIDSGLRHGDLDGSKWNTRGWTMQERCLSNRSVHFCKNKIYFECRACLRSEENEPERAQASDKGHLLPRPRQQSSNHQGAEDTNKGEAPWYEYWKRMIIQYSRRRLTMESDKLVAIESIAKEIEPYVNSRYLASAGMWPENLKRELLWYVEGGIPRYPQAYRAPTWSWASLDAKIGYIKGSRGGGGVPEPLSLVDNCDVITSPLIGAKNMREFLKLRGPHREIHKVQKLDNDDWSRASFPYDILSRDGKIFAHGILDLDNRDNLLASLPGKELIYLHLVNDQHPSGLILVRKRMMTTSWDEEGEGTRSHTPGIWMRVGAATVFQTSAELIDSESVDESYVTDDLALV